MNFDTSNVTYQEDLKIISHHTPWHKFINKSFAITGATGLLGSQIIDFLHYLNTNHNTNIKIKALGRDIEKLKVRFNSSDDCSNIEIIEYDIFKPFPEITVDFIIHCAGNSHPKLFAEHPVETIMGNILGVNSVLCHAIKKESTVLILSSGEIYGDNPLNSPMDETYIGYIDISDPRSCYPEGKRAIETIAQSYISQYGAKVKIARPCRIFGPTMTERDNKASAQFLKNGITGKDIILKSTGDQFFPYLYSPDAVSALLTILVNGQVGEAYNISNTQCNIKLKDFAKLIAKKSNVSVKFDIIGEPGGSQVKNALLNNDKLKAIGWKEAYTIDLAIDHVLKILCEQKNNIQ